MNCIHLCTYTEYWVRVAGRQDFIRTEIVVFDKPWDSNMFLTHDKPEVSTSGTADGLVLDPVVTVVGISFLVEFAGVLHKSEAQAGTNLLLASLVLLR